jgi:non-ribosomal peptide synthetase component F
VHPDLEPQIGAYLNIVALRDQVSGDDTLASVLHSVRETTLDAFAHQLYPFDRVVEDLRLKRIPGRNPLFDVGFTLQNQVEVQGRDGSRHLHPVEQARDDESLDDPEAMTDLWFIAGNVEGNLTMQLVYNGALFRPERIDRLVHDLLTVVSTAGTSPDTTVKAVPLVASDRPRTERTITIDLGL